MVKILRGLGLATIVIAITVGLLLGYVFGTETRFDGRQINWTVTVASALVGLIPSIFIYAIAVALEHLGTIASTLNRIELAVKPADPASTNSAIDKLSGFTMAAAAKTSE